MVMEDGFSDEIAPRMEPPRHRPSVFISYRREDAAGYAGHLNESLARWLEGWRLFLDVGSIQPGWEFGQAIEHAVQHADALIALIGPRWLGTDASRILAPDDFVRVEVAAGLAAGIPVIPVLVGDARLPNAAQLPEELRPLLRKHAIELRDETWRQDIERLARALQQLVQDRRRRAAQDATASTSPRPIAALDVSQADDAPCAGKARRGAILWRTIEQKVRAHPFGYGAATAALLVVVMVSASGLGVDGSARHTQEPRVVPVPVGPNVPVGPPAKPPPPSADVDVGVPPPVEKSSTPTSRPRTPTTRDANTRRNRPPAPPVPAPDCREPRRVKNVEAIASASTRARGDVRVQYEVDERGRVRSATVINSDRRRREAGFEQAALNAIRQWEFEPLAKGCPPRTLTITIEF